METCFRQTNSQILVKWSDVHYNHGNFFDGTYFTVPENGLYCFHVNCMQASSDHGEIHFYINDNEYIWAARAESSSKHGSVNIDTTLELVENDKVDVRFCGKFGYGYERDKMTNYFEGRLIARLNE